MAAVECVGIVFTKYYVFGILLLVTAAQGQLQFACSPNFCTTSVGPCPKLDCSGGRIIKNATQCGCCDICVKFLEEGEPCNNREFSLPRVECGPGLMCIDRKCAPSNTKCVRDQRAYDSDDWLKEQMTSRPRPKCDDFGDYQPVSCKHGMICFCVDKQGNRIFGTASYKEERSMNCNCSLDFHEFRGKMKRKDQFLRCTANGNYDPLQCTDDFCFCMGDDGMPDGRPISVNASISFLKCYDPERHKVYDKILRSKCWREVDVIQSQIEEYRRKGITVIGVDLPECDLDGTYAPVQCRGEVCYCAKPDGTSITYVRGTEEKYIVPRNSELARSMNCRCAREKTLFGKEEITDSVAQLFAQYQCMENGNYRKLQCIAPSCFCVDEMGFQENQTVLMHERHFLECYDKEYEKDLN